MFVGRSPRRTRRMTRWSVASNGGWSRTAMSRWARVEGVLYNDSLTYVQRRAGARPPPPSAASMPKVKPDSAVPAKRPLEKPSPAAKSENKAEEAKPRPSSVSDSQSSAKSVSKPAAPKREKSDLFSSFAKAKPKKMASTPAGSVSQGMSSLGWERSAKLKTGGTEWSARWSVAPAPDTKSNTHNL